MSQITLKHSLVNGGTAVDLPGSSLSHSFQKLNQANAAEGLYDIVPVSYGGIENPKLNIEGVIDVHDVPSNSITQELLTNFAMVRSTTPVELSVTTGTNSYSLGGRPSGGYTTGGSMTLAGTINVAIDSFDINLDTSSEQSHIWSYSIQLTEDR